MAFGAELKDFVSGFQAGYNLIDSKEEKEYKRKQRQWAEEDRGIAADDRQYARDRDAVGDERWRESFDFQKFRAGQADERDSLDRADKLVKDKLERAKEGGFRDVDEMDRFLERERGVGGEESPTGVIPEEEGATFQPAAYNDPYVSAQPAAMSAADNTGFNLDTYLASTRTSESGGNDRAKNPRSSALGRYQALKGTWNQVAKKYPELGLTPDGRTDGEQNERFMMAFTYDNAEALSNAGIPVTNGNLYAAHFLGSGGARKVLRASPRAAVADLVSPDVIKANPFLSDMSVAEFEKWADRKGNASTRRRKRSAVNAAVGGMISAIPDEDEEDNDPDFNMPEETEVAQAIPEEGPVPTPRPQYEGTSEGNEEEPTDDPYEQGRRAVRDGLKRALQQTGADGDSALADPELEKQRQNYIRGYGAAPQQMMRQVIDKIDPDRTMPPAERNMKAMGTVYQFYMDRGEPEKAQEAAASMVQFYRRASQQFLALGQAAAAQGDLDAAAKAAVAAYTNIPNGRDMQIEKAEGGYQITVTDARTGKTVNKKVLSPQEFGAAAMGFNPTTFDDEILNAAGVAPEEFKDASLEDVRLTGEEVNALAEEMLAESEFNDSQKAAIRDIAVSAATTQKNQFTPELALRFAVGLTQFNADDPNDDSAGYSTGPVRGNPDRVKVTMDGQTVVMSKNQLAALTGTRQALETDRKAIREDEAKSEAASEQRMDWLYKGVDAFKGAVTDEVGKLTAPDNEREMRVRAGQRGQQGPEMPPETADQQRNQVAIREAEQAIADGYQPGYVAAMLQEAGVPEALWPEAVRNAVNSAPGAIPD